MSPSSVDEKLLAFYCLEIFNNYASSIEARNMQRPPFDASQFGDSNKPLYVFLRLLGDELMRLGNQKKSLPGDF